MDTTLLGQLALEHAKLTADISALTERRKDVAALLSANLTTGTTTLGDHKITITVPHRISLPLIEAAYPVTRHPEFYRPALNLDAVKALIAPADLEQFKAPQSPQVRVA